MKKINNLCLATTKEEVLEHIKKGNKKIKIEIIFVIIALIICLVCLIGFIFQKLNILESAITTIISLLLAIFSSIEMLKSIIYQRYYCLIYRLKFEDEDETIR